MMVIRRLPAGIRGDWVFLTIFNRAIKVVESYDLGVNQ